MSEIFGSLDGNVVAQLGVSVVFVAAFMGLIELGKSFMTYLQGRNRVDEKDQDKETKQAELIGSLVDVLGTRIGEITAEFTRGINAIRDQMEMERVQREAESAQRKKEFDSRIAERDSVIMALEILVKKSDLEEHNTNVTRQLDGIAGTSVDMVTKMEELERIAVAIEAVAERTGGVELALMDLKATVDSKFSSLTAESAENAASIQKTDAALETFTDTVNIKIEAIREAHDLNAAGIESIRSTFSDEMKRATSEMEAVSFPEAEKPVEPVKVIPPPNTLEAGQGGDSIPKAN